MRIITKLKIIIPVVFMMLLLTACSIGEERYELTNYMGSSVATFKRRTGVAVEQQGSGVYQKEGILQIMAPTGKVTSVMLLSNAKDYMLYGVSIGMNKTEAIPLVRKVFGTEISKVINQDNTATYTYLKDTDELYLTFDVDKETVSGISYYKLDAPPEKKDTDGVQTNSGELIAMIGDTRVYYNEAMVYLKSVQSTYEAEYGKDIWNADISGKGNKFGDMIKDEVIKQITELKIIKAKAVEMGISLDEEETSEAQSYAQKHYEGLTKKDIDQYHITQELLDKVYEDNLLANKVFETLTINVDTNVPDDEAKQITVQDIFIKSIDTDITGNKTALSPEDKQKAFAKAQSLLTQ
ncbi:MAG TPA: hypothetical protein VN131_06530, partial [Mobilitalea sp.]|nr:hypothetical protein [Mobilitalea sp.]